MQDGQNRLIHTDQQQRKTSAVEVGSDKSTTNNSALRCGQCYRLTKSASALYRGDGKPLCLHLASGSLVKLTSGPYEQGRLIEVWYQGRTLVMFVEDILAAQIAP